MKMFIQAQEPKPAFKVHFLCVVKFNLGKLEFSHKFVALINDEWIDSASWLRPIGGNEDYSTGHIETT